jgi:hypothetical protein
MAGDMRNCPSSELFDEGLCVGMYDILDFTQTFRFRDQEKTVKAFSVPQKEYKGWPRVAKWEDVCR